MKQLKKLLPVLAILLTLACQLWIPDSPEQPEASKPYFTYFLLAALILYGILFVFSFLNKKLENKLLYRAPFIVGIVLLINFINIMTLKLAVLPVIFFPSLDRIIGILVEESVFLLKCIVYSFRLLLLGFFIGGIVGFATGILLGFSKVAVYWITPVTKVIGPIPSTAWLPLVLSSFPSSFSASVFLIALAVWFPTTLMTSSGIQNVQNSYFEVSKTLGASTFYQIFRVAVPAAMPSIFLGVFFGTVSSFITLMTAEMVGSSYGIGWYINWQKQMMVYPGVYAGLIIIALICVVILTSLFKVKDKILVWQKGVIKW